MAIVTFEAVAAAAEALQAAGQRASVRAVTAAIGGGSPNTVLKLLGEWKAGRPVVRIADTELDPKITTAIVEQMQRVATAAAAAAEERAAGVDEDLQALSEAQAAAEQQINTLSAERDMARVQAAELAEQLESTQDEAHRAAEQATAAAAGLRQELTTERTRQEAAAAALARAEVRLEAVPSLQADIERLRAALAEAQQGRTAAEQQAAVLNAKLDATADRAARAEARSEQAEQEAIKAAKAHEDARTAAAQELRSAQAQAQAAGQEAARLAGHLEALHQTQTAAPEQGRGKGKTTHPPVQKSFEVE